MVRSTGTVQTARKKIDFVVARAGEALRHAGFSRRGRTARREVGRGRDRLEQRVGFFPRRGNSLFEGEWGVHLDVLSPRILETWQAILSERVDGPVWSKALCDLLPDTPEAWWPPGFEREDPRIIVDQTTDAERLAAGVSRMLVEHALPMLDRLSTLDGVLAVCKKEPPSCSNAVLAAECGDLDAAASIFRAAMVDERRTPIEFRPVSIHDCVREWLASRGADVADVRVDLHAGGVTGAPRLLERIRSQRARR